MKNGITLSSGVAVAQVLPFLFYPLLGRIFAAEEFGLLATLTSIITVLSVVGAGEYSAGIIVAKNKLQAANLAVLSVVVGFVSMLLSWLLCQFVLHDEIVSWFHHSEELGRWIFVCPLSAFFIIIFNIYNEWCIREKCFKSLAANKIINSGAVVLSKTFLGFVRICSQGLVVGDLIGRAISAIGCVMRAWARDRKTFVQIRWKEMGKCAVEFKEFPLFNMPGKFLNTVGQSLPVLFLAAYFGDTEVGYFSMAMMLFSVPINIISTSVGDVYRQRATEEYRANGQCLASFKKVMWALTLLGVAAFLLLEWFLPSLTRMFLGKEEWYMAGKYAQIIAPAMVVMFVSNSLRGMFVVADKLKDFFFWQLYFAVSTLASVWIGGAVFGTVRATLILFSILRCTAYFSSILLTYRYAKGECCNGKSSAL